MNLQKAFSLIFFVLAMTACQTTAQKNQALLVDRVQKLKPLSNWKPTWCQVESQVTQPVMSRYRSLYPKEIEKQSVASWAYTWKARENTCEVTSLEDSPMLQNHKAFLETALCTLLQVHWVNSPFDELQIKEEDVVSNENKVQIRASAHSELGLFLDRQVFSVQTKTKSRGTFEVIYAQNAEEWLPQKISQTNASSQIVLDQFEYSTELVGGRRMVKSFWLSLAGLEPDPNVVGAKVSEAPMAYTHLNISQCQNY